METSQPSGADGDENSNNASAEVGLDQQVPQSGKLDPEVKAAWLQALRSGEYEQGTETLRTYEDTYCCLGVLCELAVQANVIQCRRRPHMTGEWEYGSDEDGDWMAGFPPMKVRRWAGFPREDRHGTAIPSNPWVLVPRAWLNHLSYDRQAALLEVAGTDPASASVRLSLSTANDRAHLTFEQIAQLIEEQL
jgi:hypothetical protein